MPGPGRRDERLEAARTAGLLLAIPTLLIVSPLAGFFGGSLLDGWIGTAPWFTVVGLALGFIAGGRQTYLIYRRYTAQEEERRRRR